MGSRARVPPSLSLIDLHLDYLRASAKDDLAGGTARCCAGASKISGVRCTKGYWTPRDVPKDDHLRGCEGIEGVRGLAPKLEEARRDGAADRT